MQTIEPAAPSPAGERPSAIAPTGRFLRNAWYPVFWSGDIAPGALVERVVLNEPIVFFRRDDGTPAALADLCPHRFAPLHLGKRCPGDRIRCGYHGLEFDADGVCVRNPYGDGRIPAGTSVPTYPLAEKHGIVWIWMGGRAPDHAQIPDFSIFEDPGEGAQTKFDYINLPANYELIVDNLMDLSHIAFLHDGFIGNEYMTKGEIEVRQDGNQVTVSRLNPDVPVVPLYDLLFRQDGRPVDFWDSIRCDVPGSFLLDVGVRAPGTSKAEGTGLFAVHLLTPETETTTHYNFSAVRQNVAAGQKPTPEIAAKIGEMRRHIFQNQDSMMISAQQAMLRRYPALTRKPALFSIDAGPARYKRVLRAMLDAEDATG